MQRRYLYSAITLGLSLAALGVWAAAPPSFTLPFSFTAHTAANASEVNANFTALEAQIQYLNQQLIAEQTINNDQQSRITTLQNSLAAVQGSAIMQLDPYVDLAIEEDGQSRYITYPTIRFVGVNVEILNGTGSTFGTPNGLGNLTIGYNEYRNDANTLKFCSDGHYDNQTDCQSHDGTWDINQRTGSHNLVLGISNSYTSFGGFLAGQYNVVNGAAGSVSGGLTNMASGRFASVSGGENNTASNEGAAVSGGRFNVASGSYASVSGGGGQATTQGNVASGIYSSVSGGGFTGTAGHGNHANGDHSSVSGGENNTATGQYSSVSGGYTISTSLSSVPTLLASDIVKG